MARGRSGLAAAAFHALAHEPALVVAARARTIGPRDRRGRPAGARGRRLDEIVPIGPVLDGIRFHNRCSGIATAGPLAGGRVTGIDYVLVRYDGVGVVDASEIMTIDSQRVAIYVTGYFVPPPDLPIPSREEFADPGFTWPD